MRIPLSAPIDVTIEVTSSCNLTCTQCLSAARRNASPDLPLATLMRLGKEFARLKVFMVTFSGGEPLLRGDFLYLASQFVKLGISVGFSTNGTLITHQVAESIRDNGLSRGIQVSLDGSKSIVHDGLRGKGSFNAALSGLRCLIEEGIRPSVGFTITSRNIDDVPAFLDFVEGEGCRHAHLMLVMPSGRALREYQELLPTPARLRELGTFLRQHATRCKHGFTFDSTNLDHCPTGPDFDINMYSSVDRLYTGCPAGVVKAAIDAAGNVLGCDILRDQEWIAGNISVQSFSAIWNDSPVFARWRARDADSIRGKCRNCVYVPACVGGCPAITLLRTGDFFESDPTCEH